MTESTCSFKRIGCGDPRRYSVLDDLGVEIGSVREAYRGRFGKTIKAYDLDGKLVGSGSTRAQAAEALVH